MNTGLMAGIKYSAVLLATLVLLGFVCLSSSVSFINSECAVQGAVVPDVDPVVVEINCTAFRNGTLNAWWSRTNPHRLIVSMDYNCTSWNQTDNLLDYMYIGDEKGSTAVNLLPSVSTSVIPSCYIDGCYEYTSGRVTTTYAIPTVTCSLIPSISPSFYSTKVISSATVTVSTSLNVEPTTTTHGPSGGLKSYIWLVLLLVPGILICVPLLAVYIRWRRQKRKWWLYSDKTENKDRLLWNEPCIDPLFQAESDYCETETIVDPLDTHGQGSHQVVMTKIPRGDSTLIQALNQKAGGSDDHSFSGGSDTSESGSMPMESGSNGQEEDNLSTCTQTVDHRVVVGLHSSDSEEERLLTNSGGSAHMVIKRATRSAEPISQQECNPSSTADETCKSLSSPAEPAVPTASVHAGSRVLVISPEDKTRCHSDSNTRKSLCDSNNVSYPEYIPSSEYSVSSGNGMPSVLNSSDIDDAEINDLMTAEDMMDDRPIERNGDFSLTHEKSIPADDPNNLPSANSNGIQIQAHRSELNPDSQHHSQQQQQQQEFHDDYVSSSDYMSSVLSERGTSSTIGNSTTDYFADIDTELESVAVTQNGLQDAHGSHDNNCTEEVDRSDHEPQDDTHAELTELKHALISALPQTYTQQAQRSSVRPRPTLLPVRKEEDKQLYCAVVRPLVNEDFDRHSSDYMYIGSDLPYLRNIQDDEDTLGSDDHIYEEMHQQFESPDSSNGGYVDLSTVCIGGTQQMPQNYQYETTV